MTNKKLNRSCDALASAMRAVIVDVVEEGIAPLRKDIQDIGKKMGAMEGGLNMRMDTLEGGFNMRMDTLDSNFKAQLAQNRKDISSDVRQIVRQQSSG